MSKHFLFKTTAIFSAIISINAYAIEFGKPITTSITITKPGLQGASIPAKKQITLMNIKLNTNEKQALMNYKPQLKDESADTLLPTSTQLGMNGVPVLDQGQHGSCVTFASTGAIDAVIGKGDYVSQLCQLELGAYLEKDGYLVSGWDGSWGPWVLDQMNRFGIVSIKDQKSKGCAGVTNYPLDEYYNTGHEMTLDEFKTMSVDVSEKFYPIYLMNAYYLFDNPGDTSISLNALKQVKQGLVRGNRSTFGTLVVVSACEVGACAKHNKSNDTWALTKEVENFNDSDVGGHEMIITGYDDKAIAVDNQGKKHRGLLTLRNSWGEEAGDKGNYYMTYDYFKKFALEAQVIVKAQDKASHS